MARLGDILNTRTKVPPTSTAQLVGAHEFISALDYESEAIIQRSKGYWGQTPISL